MKKFAVITTVVMLCAALCACGTPSGSQPATTASAATTAKTVKTAVLPHRALEKPPYIQDGANILFIGNSQLSYNNTPSKFADIARTNGKNVTVNSLLQGNTALDGHLSAIIDNRNHEQDILKLADIVILQDLGFNCDSKDVIQSIGKYCKDGAKLYFFMTKYNTGLHPDVWRYSSENCVARMMQKAERSPYDAWKKYIENKADDSDKALLDGYFIQSPCDVYKDLDLYYIPAGDVFDYLLFNLDYPLETLTDPSDYIHPSALLSYADALTVYEVLYGGAHADQDLAAAEWNVDYDLPTDLAADIDTAIQQSV